MSEPTVFQLSNAPSQNMPVHVLILEKFFNCMNQSFCTLFFLPKTWAAAFWRTALSSSTSVLQVDSLSSRNCSSSTFLSSSKRVSSFLGGLVPLFFFFMEKRHRDRELVINEAVCCTIDVCQCNI